jgi:hypothetical protein
MAVSLALTGASGGGILVAPALLALVAHWGFTAAVRTAALVMVVMLVPLAVIVFRQSPEGLGVGPDGDPYRHPPRRRCRRRARRGRRSSTRGATGRSRSPSRWASPPRSAGSRIWCRT